MAVFRVIVPFEPVIRETLDSRGFSNIPDADLAVGIQIRGSADGYTAELKLEANGRRQLQEAIEGAVEAVDIAEFRERVVQRVLSTTTGPVANHVDGYLRGVGIEDTSPVDINRWWRVRGAIAHGGSVDIELG